MAAGNNCSNVVVINGQCFLSDIRIFSSSVAVYFISIVVFEFSKLMPMLNQIIDGLRCFGTYDLIKEFPDFLEPVFVQSGCFSLTPEEFLEDIKGEFSENGSNYKQQEINIFKYFHDYVEGKSEETRNVVNHCLKYFKYRQINA